MHRLRSLLLVLRTAFLASTQLTRRQAPRLAVPAGGPLRGLPPAVPGDFVRSAALHWKPPEHDMARFRLGGRWGIGLPGWRRADLRKPRRWQVDHGQLARFVLKPAAHAGSRWIHAGIGLNTECVRVRPFPVRSAWLLRAGDRGRRCAQGKPQASEETVSRDRGANAWARSHSCFLWSCGWLANSTRPRPGSGFQFTARGAASGTASWRRSCRPSATTRRRTTPSARRP